MVAKAWPWLAVGGGAAGLAAAVLAVSGVLGTGSGTSQPVDTSAAPGVSSPVGTSSDPLAQDIVRQQDKARATPGDYVAWATLGLDYVQQAKITVNPAYYPKASGALERSLALNSTVNYQAMAGMATLKAAEHNFTAARSWAQRGLAIDNYNPALYGALDDADTQLGLYDQAFAATQRMNDLHPGVPAFTRAEYVFELRGDISNAQAAMRRALDEATTPADRAFTNYYLGELAFNSGNPKAALSYAAAGLAADPSYSALLEGRAKAEAALGQNDAAVRDYLKVISEVPQPTYLIEAGELLQSLGRTKQAEQQYRLFNTENQLFVANGVTLDTDPTLFYADHGDPQRALKYGQVGIRIRPFVEMDDAYAWALHVNHRDLEALAYEKKAMQLGTRNALFYFHAGMIDKSLGRSGEAAADLRKALAINPYFNPYQLPVLNKALAELGGGR